MSAQINYKSAGVNVEAGENLVRNIKQAVEATHTPAVLSPLGGFAGLYDLSSITQNYEAPVLVQSIDGVGTKSIVAGMMNDFSSLGQDLVSATVNDIIVCGAKPLTLLDYVASDKLRSQQLTSLIGSIAKACFDVDIALVGGETAEMPDTYLSGEHDVVGIVSGVVEKSKIIDGSKVSIGDKVIGLPSTGLHTNGYSLAREVFFKHAQKGCDSYVEELGMTVGEVLLSPHKNYTHIVHGLLEQGCQINAMSHISGGGLGGNLNRVLPKHCDAMLTKSFWPVLPLFLVIQQLGNITSAEMFRAFNMGIGYTLVVPEMELESICQQLHQMNEPAYVIGEITEGTQTVKII